MEPIVNLFDDSISKQTFLSCHTARLHVLTRCFGADPFHKTQKAKYSTADKTREFILFLGFAGLLLAYAITEGIRVRDAPPTMERENIPTKPPTKRTMRDACALHLREW
jgi:hypothetical protein